MSGYFTSTVYSLKLLILFNSYSISILNEQVSVQLKWIFEISLNVFMALSRILNIDFPYIYKPNKMDIGDNIGFETKTDNSNGLLI